MQIEEMDNTLYHWYGNFRESGDFDLLAVGQVMVFKCVLEKQVCWLKVNFIAESIMYLHWVCGFYKEDIR